MDADRLLYLFREYLFMDEEASSTEYVEEMLRDYCGASQEEIAYLKGEVNNGTQY